MAPDRTCCEIHLTPVRMADRGKQTKTAGQAQPGGEEPGIATVEVSVAVCQEMKAGTAL